MIRGATVVQAGAKSRISDTRLLPWSRALSGVVRRVWDHPVFVLPRDYRLFLLGARTDAAVERVRAVAGPRLAFEQLYAASDDPWASAAPRFRYQERKYELIMGLLPDRRYRHSLDLGCGLGMLSRRLAACSDRVLGIDVAETALSHARSRSLDVANLSFAQGDLQDLPEHLDNRFDLVVVADTLYYLSPLGDELLKTITARVANLLAPGGMCLLANHFFFGADRESRQSRRIHDAFSWSSGLAVLSQHRHAFFLATLLVRRDLH